jgi:Transposase DDE domain group 1
VLPETAWTVAVDAAGEPRPVDQSGLPVAQVAELTGLLPSLTASGWPEGMRVIVRRERPHPGAQISVFEAHDGWRYQCLATDTTVGQLAFLEARHRAHARVEDNIRTAKQTGLGRFPSREFTINAVWLQLALTAADLIAWTQSTCSPERSRRRSRNCCATGCCTPPPGSPTADGGPSSRSRPAGPGPTNSPRRSPDSPTSNNRCWPDRQLPCPPPTKDPWRPGHHAGRTRMPSGEDQQPLGRALPTKIIPGLTKE